MLAIIRGAGDIATAIALRLWKCGISVVMTEIEQPLTVRRTVALDVYKRQVLRSSVVCSKPFWASF